MQGALQGDLCVTQCRMDAGASGAALALWLLLVLHGGVVLCLLLLLQTLCWSCMG